MNMFLFLLSIHVIGFLGRMLTLFHILKNCQIVFQMVAPFYIPTSKATTYLVLINISTIYKQSYFL